MFIFRCNGEDSEILESLSGADLDLGVDRIISSSGTKVLKVLTAEDPHFTLSQVKTKESLPLVDIHFRHEVLTN